MNKKFQSLKRYSYLLLCLYVPLYLLMFHWLELFVPSSAHYWVSYCYFDDLIPFDEHFVLFYYMWYPFLVFLGLFLIFKDSQSFKRYMYFIAIGFTFSIIVCLLFPNGQNLRPTIFADDNFMVDMVKALYRVDTNTNVIPSVHVIGAFAGMFGVLTTKKIKSQWIRISSIFLGIMIIISTVFIKQHSVLDIIAGVIVSAILYYIVYIVIRNKMQKSENNIE